MSKRPTEAQIKNAWRAVDFSKNTRAYHRRRTRPDSRQRYTDVQVALEKIKNSMAPLRSYLGGAAYGPQNAEAAAFTERVKEASAALQSERRKLWKLIHPTRKPKKEPTHAE